MKLIKKIGIGVGAAIVVFVLVVATRPSTFHVERSITMAAHPESAFVQVNDFHAWATWSPYEKLDPQMKRSFEGAPSGSGAIYAWAGNDKAGEGKMTIEKSDKPSLVVIKLEFTKPFAQTSTATFTFVPVAEGTKVTWAMDGESNFVGKAFSLFVNMDKLLGSDFERGLAAMKANAESAPKPSTEAVK